MAVEPPKRLVLFLTRGVPLSAWEAIGSFSRETELYRRLTERGVHVSIVSWGGAKELEFADRLPGMAICCNRWGLPRSIYEAWIPWLHRGVLKRADLIKTNQMDGADIALRAARRWGKPLIARCGYMWSKNRLLEDGPGSAQALRALEIESLVFGAAERIAVTTEEMKAEIARRFPDRAGATAVIPNYVDTDLFSPRTTEAAAAAKESRPRLVFVGRLAPEKNLESLLAAIKGMQLDLELIGQGPLANALNVASAMDSRIMLAGKTANEKLPGHLRRATIYVQPSLYEGHPKTIVEAMACGACVLATDVAGIRETIRHGETGWLTGTDAASLRSGIERLLGDAALRKRLGDGARRYAVENYSLDRILEQELALYASLRSGTKQG